ncbi:hypothetical protein [Candidatus Mycoplasma haematominutum]|uniref:hypothetical protein n=1 Tax=Candidatus Mycoplasma haematominutum TaxID=209446 RepID=UPI0002E8CC61|nr:hypothetical protein [Candidatus Mycoplasma haematominutum]
MEEVSKQLNFNDRRKFQSALDKVKNFGITNTLPAPRIKRSPKSMTTSPHLDLQEKQVISAFFSKFESLDSEQSKLFSELSKTSEVEQLKKLNSASCISCIPKHLRTIGFTSQELNIFHQRTRHRSSPINKYQYYSDNPQFEKEQAKTTWGAWESSSHPYRYLFESEQDWLDAVGRISDVWKAYYSTMNSRGRITCVVTSMVLPIGNLCNAGKAALEKEIEDSKAALELEISTKLMNIMKRLQTYKN